MARNYGADLEPEPIYRSVMLFLYPGVHSMELKTYTDSSGEEHQYHASRTFGPYTKRNPAIGILTKELGYHASKIENGQYTRYGTKSVPYVTVFVEEQVPQWKSVDGSKRIA